MALPPPDKPFQMKDAGRNILYGFNVDLAEEIAGMLQVKTNLRMLSSEEMKEAADNCKKGEYDLVFLPSGSEATKLAGTLPYFYDNDKRAWHSLCAGGPGNSLRRAANNILSYMNESGGFMQMYATYFNNPTKTIP